MNWLDRLLEWKTGVGPKNYWNRDQDLTSVAEADFPLDGRTTWRRIATNWIATARDRENWRRLAKAYVPQWMWKRLNDDILSNNSDSYKILLKTNMKYSSSSQCPEKQYIYNSLKKWYYMWYVILSRFRLTLHLQNWKNEVYLYIFCNARSYKFIISCTSFDADSFEISQQVSKF